MSNSEQGPITPPHELVTDWCKLPVGNLEPRPTLTWVATQAARWGYEQRGAANEAELQKARDEELEACRCFLLTRSGALFDYGPLADDLRAARRSKLPSDKELALEALDRLDQFPTAEDKHLIRRALEALPE